MYKVHYSLKKFEKEQLGLLEDKEKTFVTFNEAFRFANTLKKSETLLIGEPVIEV